MSRSCPFLVSNLFLVEVQVVLISFNFVIASESSVILNLVLIDYSIFMFDAFLEIYVIFFCLLNIAYSFVINLSGSLLVINASFGTLLYDWFYDAVGQITMIEPISRN